MIRNTTQLKSNFERHYKLARWLGLLAGAFGFPVLSIPAFIGVWRLSKYRKLMSRDRGDSTFLNPTHKTGNEQGDDEREAE